MLKALAIAALLATGLALPAAPAVAAPKSSEYLAALCRSALQTKIVRKEAVRAVGPEAHVRVIPFCVGIQIMDFGNAAGLGKTIGANPVLARALKRAGWLADDVTSIRIDGNSVRLYVHRE